MGLHRRARPLLTASLGVASITITACGGGATTGNLMAPPPCPGTQVHTGSGYDDCADECPPCYAVLGPTETPGYDYCEPVDPGPTDGGQDGAVDDGGVDGGADPG